LKDGEKLKTDCTFGLSRVKDKNTKDRKKTGRISSRRKLRLKKRRGEDKMY
jgi:hypothetical protein